MKYRFFEVLNEIIGTDRRIRCKGSIMARAYGENWISFKQGTLTDCTDVSLAWPTIEQQKAEIWEVEPEALYVWGICDEDDRSWLSLEVPNIMKSDMLPIQIHFEQSGLFPKDKPQKFQLIPMDDT